VLATVGVIPAIIEAADHGQADDRAWIIPRYGQVDGESCDSCLHKQL